jgi:hypothetical protein
MELIYLLSCLLPPCSLHPARRPSPPRPPQPPPLSAITIPSPLLPSSSSAAVTVVIAVDAAIKVAVVVFVVTAVVECRRRHRRRPLLPSLLPLTSPSLAPPFQLLVDSCLRCCRSRHYCRHHSHFFCCRFE